MGKKTDKLVQAIELVQSAAPDTGLGSDLDLVLEAASQAIKPEPPTEIKTPDTIAQELLDETANADGEKVGGYLTDDELKAWMVAAIVADRKQYDR